MNKGINLGEIVEREDFQQELKRAAVLSYENNRESGFCVWTDEKYEITKVNEAILGGETYNETDLTEGAIYEEGKGSHIPLECYRLVDIHFHPPKHHLRPSPADINEELMARRVNRNLRDVAGECHREILKENGELKDYEVNYINPTAIIGLAKEEEIELLAYQSRGKKLADVDDFSEFAARYYKRLYGKEYEALTLLVARYPFRFKSGKRVAKFLNESKYFQAEYLKIKKGELRKRDKEKLKKFKLIQTKFFPNEKEVEEEDDRFERLI